MFRTNYVAGTRLHDARLAVIFYGGPEQGRRQSTQAHAENVTGFIVLLAMHDDRLAASPVI